ncbi:MAG: methylated-DNA--[protein]-cysteine S-methyltransferase [Dysgonamonadaceae bacterium]|jgi:AraC family transcriptional regulator of adaptative response/methylated-DNA-[protein]-cysteine methyltransferase|nr:methylated-DNA--[protein]-cysteine S-methyltransferase [Dysgonamonadaceae bacterium]
METKKEAFNSTFDENEKISEEQYNMLCETLFRYSPLKSKDKPVVNIIQMDTAFGLMIAAATGKGVCMLDYPHHKLTFIKIGKLGDQFKISFMRRDNPHLDALEKQLDEYFNRKRKNFDVPLDLIGTDFQKKVWLSLMQIPYGSTISYKEQAEMLKCPGAERSVANANGKNKIPIILPCHRVIGSNGSLAGYTGGVLYKRKLLKFEQGIGSI